MKIQKVFFLFFILLFSLQTTYAIDFGLNGNGTGRNLYGWYALTFINVNGSINATSFIGEGSRITNISAGALPSWILSNDSTLNIKIDNLNSSLTNNINQVQSNLDNAVTNISNVNSSLMNEINNRISADTALNLSINNNANNIANVQLNVTNLNTSLTNSINLVQNNLNSAVTNISNVNSSLELAKTQINNINSTKLSKFGDTATGNYTFDTNTFFINADSNNVGVGTINPSQKLEVLGIARISNGTFQVINTGANAQVDVRGSANLYNSTLYLSEDGSSGGGFLFDSIGNVFHIQTGTSITTGGGTNRISIIRDTGLVGIGLPNPTANLHVNGTSMILAGATTGTDTVLTLSADPTNVPEDDTSRIVMSQDGGGTITAIGGIGSVQSEFVGAQHNYGAMWNTVSGLQFASANTTAILIDTSQRVGIGTLGPSARLHINSTGTTNPINPDLMLSGTLSAIAASRGIVFTNANTALSMAYITMTTDPVGNQGELAFGTATSTSVNATERMRIDNSGQVGIGTSIPLTRLHLSSASTNPTSLRIDANGTGGESSIELNANGNNWSILSDDGSDLLRIFQDTTARAYLTSTGFGLDILPNHKLDVLGTTRINQTLILSNGKTDTGTLSMGAADFILNGTSGTYTFWGYSGGYVQMLSMDDDQRIGIGTTTPQYLLDVDKSQNTATRLVVNNNNTGVSARSMISASSNAGGITIQQPSQAFTDVPAWTNSSILSFSGKDLWIHGTDGDNPNIIFALNGSAASTERMRITSRGFVGINTTTPSQALDVVGTLRLNSTNVIDLSPGSAGTFDRLDFKAVRNNLGISFQLTPNGNSQLSKLAFTNSNSTSVFGSGYIGVENTTMIIAPQGVGTGSTNITTLLIGGTSATYLGGVNFNKVVINSTIQTNLTGSGNDYVCVDATGTLFRSNTAC